MKAKEAKQQKCCPLKIFTASVLATHGMKPQDHKLLCYCVADDCMMWRRLGRERSEGYCGLAGKG